MAIQRDRPYVQFNFLVDLGDFQGMNEVYARHVGDTPPARATIEVAALPTGARVEIEAIAQS